MYYLVDLLVFEHNDCHQGYSFYKHPQDPGVILGTDNNPFKTTLLIEPYPISRLIVILFSIVIPDTISDPACAYVP